MTDNKIVVNLENYPALAEMKASDPDKFKATMKSIFVNAAKSIDNGYNEKSEQYFKVSYSELMQQMTEAMFDYKGILKFHHNKQEAEAMQILAIENNPLAATGFYTTDGKELTKAAFFGEEELTIKDWFQSLLYAGRFLSQVDLVKYLILPEFHMVHNMQNEHIERLLKIQPALKYQQDNEIRVGSCTEGTGFFHVGKIVVEDRCPICYSEKIYTEPFHKIHYCLNCNAGIEY